MLNAAFKHMWHLIPISGTHVKSSGDEIWGEGHFEALSDLGEGNVQREAPSSYHTVCG